ncbi:two component transcriptional regulator, LuxR family [Crinalium epipsammum PCC 9333]|uniref:Two component transcriptional regulator, LuxR family n=1 Tax=Crinalium epipsammum PCC 9333 TaxID=1173022 RepID=K9W2M9_9CYAN|nr:response regulator transcription factor [Crinalium epipsammum]AFZ14039.1 two component transcriptional regulator, LuxR family [Crinalium epipsammum PCC 9333]
MKKILVVDDDRTLRTILSHHLHKQGYQVNEASSGVEALTAFEQEPPDVVVSDVMMPEMNGLEFCRQLRASRFGQLVPFIFLSAKGDLEDRIKGHTIGGDDYLTKPVDPRELIAKIEAQLERSRRIHSEMVMLMQHLASRSPAMPLPPAPEKPLLEKERTVEMVSTQPVDLPLTPAEARVFWEVIQGFTNKQISDRLFISPRTVQTHLSNILNKLDLANRSQLVRFAYENGYRLPEPK